jgi:hypothetical protein
MPVGDATKATITIRSPERGQVVRTQAVEVRGTWTGPALTNPKVEIRLTGRPPVTVTPDASGSWSHTFPRVPNGDYEVVAYLSADSKAPVDHGPVSFKVDVR